jgi:hypothetical protein
MSNIECATLILNTKDLTTTQTQLGIRNASNTQQTWSNISIRDVVGATMFDKYDLFNIILIENIQTVLLATTTFPSNNDKIGLLMMSGLNFRNCTYSAATKTQTSQACIGFLMGSAMSTTVGVGQQYFSNYNTFGKHSVTVDLTISLMKVSDGLLASTSILNFPEQSYIFKIYGIPK